MAKLKQHQHGLAAIEMTLILPILLLLFFATTEFSRLLYQYNTLNKMVREASRYLSHHARDGSTNVINILDEKKSNVRSNATAILIYGDLNSTSEILPLAAQNTNVAIDVNGEFITVTVIYDWKPLFFEEILPSFVSATSFDLVTRYTVRAR